MRNNKNLKDVIGKDGSLQHGAYKKTCFLMTVEVLLLFSQEPTYRVKIDGLKKIRGDATSLNCLN